MPGAVFAKEVWLTGKRVGSTWIRTIYLLLVLGIVTLVFVSSLTRRMAMGNEGVANVAQLQELQQLAPSLSLAVLWCQFVMLTLVGAMMGATAISEERRSGTLATLLTTPLKSWQIVLGKLLGRSVELLILALLTVPLLLGLRVYGGMPATAILAGSALCIVSTIFATQLGMFFSVRSKRTIAPMVGVFATLIVLWMALPLGIMGVSQILRTGGAPGSSVWIAVGTVCLPMALGDVTSRQMGGGAFASMPLWPWSVAFHLVLLVVLFVASSGLLRWTMAREATGAPVGRKQKRARASAAAAVAEPMPASPQAGAPARAPRAPRAESLVDRTSRVVGDRPVLWREMQQKLVRRTWAKWLLGLFVAGLLAFIYFMSELDGVQVVLTVIGVIIAMIAGALAATSTISQEREGRTLDVLLTTPLSAWEIVWGKYLGSARKLLFIPALVLLNLVLSGPLAPLVMTSLRWMDPFFFQYPRAWVVPNLHWIGIVLGIMGTLMPIVFLPGVGVLMSTLVKRSSAAAALTMLVGAGLWGGLPLLCAMVVDLFGRQGKTILDLSSVVLWINPVALTGEGLTSAERVSSLRSNSHFELYQFHGSGINLHPATYTLWMGLVVGGYLLAGLFCLKLAARRLKDQTGRRK